MAARLLLTFAAAAATVADTAAGGISAADGASSAAFQVVLFGPYSNLARKYLWQALFELHVVAAAAGAAVDVRAASRDGVEAGAKKLADIFAHNVTGDASAKAAFQACCVRYYPIASDADYAAFGDALAASELSDAAVAEVAVSAEGDSLSQQRSRPTAPAPLLSRAVYMSVAPDIVEGILRRLRVHGRVAFSPSGSSGSDSSNSSGSSSGSSADSAGKHAVLPDGARLLATPTRLLLEKPLGRDEASAVSLLSGIERHLHSGGANADGSAASGVLAIDHYLAKVGLLAAAGIRSAALVAPAEGGAKGLLRSMLGGSASVGSESSHSRFAASLQRMIAAMLETETAHGRTGFYNDYGAVRDVLQNHISLLAAAASVRAASDWSLAGRGAMLQRWRWGAGSLTTAEEDGLAALQASLAGARAAQSPALVAAMGGGLSSAASAASSSAGDSSTDGLTPLPQPHLPLRVGRYAGYAGHVAEEQTSATREAVTAAEAAAAADIAATCAADDSTGSSEGESTAASTRSYAPWIWPPRSAAGAAAGAAAATYRAAHGGRSPAPREIYGAGFAGPTAADVRMRVHDAGVDSDGELFANGIDGGSNDSVPLRFVAGKAAGVRVAFAAHEFSVSSASDTDAAAHCAGLAYYHVQGTPLLPASLRNAMAAARLRGTGLVHRFASSAGPSILLAVWPNASAAASAGTGGAAGEPGGGRQWEPDIEAINACDAAAGELSRGAGEWWFTAAAAAARDLALSTAAAATTAAQAGAASSATAASPSVGPFPSWAAWLSKWQLATLAPPGTGIGLVLLYPPDEEVEAQSQPASAPAGNARAGAAAREAIASVAQRPSSTSAGAYRMIIAAGLAAHEAAFVSPSEAQRLWQLWGRAADTADAVVAAHTTNRTAALPHDALCRLHTPSDADSEGRAVAQSEAKPALAEGAAFTEHTVGSSHWSLPGWVQL